MAESAFVASLFASQFEDWGQTERCPVFPAGQREARASYEKALALTQQDPERQFLQERIRQLE